MRKRNNLKRINICIFAILFTIQIIGCKKEETPVVDACAGKTIIINTTIDSATTVTATDGKITVNASGSTGFTYKLNSTGTYGSATSFLNLTNGTYTVFVKDAAGCEKTKSVVVPSKIIAVNPCDGVAGPKFTAVRNLINTNCIGCHSGTSPSGGRDWTVDCNVVTNKSIINNRAVVIGDMPQGGPTLSASDKQKITDWINAGGRKTD
jgi:hypothetical protein